MGLTRETAEILWYALSSSGNFEGYQDRAGKVSQGHYILEQAATWAIMSGNWNGLEDFQNQMELEYELPLTWSYKLSGNQITFTCTDGNPDIGLVRGRFKEGSLAAQYWIKPNTFKIWYPDGWTEESDTEGKQAMITMAGREEPWEVWLQFGKDSTTITSGRYEIPYERHEHEETFKRNYKIELIKYDSETGKPLENSDFEILEQFDFSQLDGTNLESDYQKAAASLPERALLL